MNAIKLFMVSEPDRTCKICNKIFTPRAWNSETCSPVCSNKLKMIRQQKRFKERYHNDENFRNRVKESIYESIKRNNCIPSEQDKLFKELAQRQELESNKILDDKCYVCGGNKKLVGHHISYTDNEIITLCSKCHSLLHVRYLYRLKCRIAH